MSIRIIGLGEVSTIQDGDFIAVDNATNGTHKFDATKLGSNLSGNIAPPYNSAAVYDKGDFVMYQNTLYECNTAITTPEAWNASHWTQTSAGVALENKVDKVEGMGLSENDFTDALKSKLDGIQAGAEVNVQADWAEADSDADDYIKNKPTDATTTVAGLMSAADKTKLNGIASGAEVNVQADWSQTNTSADDYIKNKPSVATGSADGLMSAADKEKLDGIQAGAEVNVQANWAETNTSADDYIKNKPGVATESTDGLMSSSDKTKLDGIANGAEVNVQADWNQTNTSADDFIKNKPVDATESVGGLMSATDKAKLDGIQAGAEVNVIDGVKVDGVALTPDANKDVDIVGKANQASIAEQYSTTATYVYDDYVIYDNTLYRCVADTSGAWDASDWEAVNIGDELEHKANIDGAYDDMTVGNAEQLVSSVAINEHQPYNFRPSGGSVDIGDRKTEEIVGGSLAWNQLATLLDSATINEVTFTNNGDGSVTVNGTASGNARWEKITTPLENGHVYALYGCPSGGSTNTYRMYSSYTSLSEIGSGVVFKWLGNSLPAVKSEIFITSGYTANNLVFKPQYFDLTAMFGTEIADYLYTLETSTAGAGVARFRKYFPKPYYAYDAGSLQSVNLRSGVMTGLNQWDEEWESGRYNPDGTKEIDNSRIRNKNMIPVLSNMTYYAKFGNFAGNYGNVYFYDSNGAFISYATPNASTHLFTTPNGASYLNFFVSDIYGTTYNNDICINLHWDGEYDGVYEPYIAHTYQYDPDLELRGIPKLDENNYLTYDGDVYESDGTVTRKYGIVDLGTLDWVVAIIDANTFVAVDNNIIRISGAAVPNSICAMYSPVSGEAIYNKTADKRFCLGNGYFFATGVSGVVIRDTAYTDAATFKDAMSGVYLVYELATPTTETAQPYTNPQIVNDFGTESFIDSLVEQGTRDVSIPVGHNTKYLANLKAKLEMAPNSPDGDGKYIVQQTDGMNYYVNFEPEIANKANVDGAYEDMTVGNAEQLLASVYTDDQIPYNFRQSGGGISVGDREIDKIVGGTVAWNQCMNVPTGTASVGSHITITGDASNGSVRCVSDGENETGNMTLRPSASNYSISFTPNHKILYITGYNSSISGIVQSLRIASDSSGSGYPTYILDAQPVNKVGIFNVPSGLYYGYWYLPCQSQNVVFDYTFYPQLFDLTQMFGSTIADYIYSLEEANEGDGVAWFRNLFPEPYYAYDAGSLQSVNTSAHEMVGFNQWDEELLFNKTYFNGNIIDYSGYAASQNKIRVIPNTTYYVNSPFGIEIIKYDGNKNYLGILSSSIKNNVFTVPDGCYYIAFGSAIAITSSYGTTYNNDICINLSHNGSRNGEYEPYVKHTYALDSSLTLRGIPKLDSSNRLYYDGDSYASDGTVERRYGIVDLGTCDWEKVTISSGVYGFRLNTSIGCVVQSSTSAKANIICSKYPTILQSSLASYDKVISGLNWSNGIIIRDDTYTDAAAFKSAMSGVYLVYELAEPTTETATTYQNPQVVNDWGTEEYVDYAYTQGTRDVAVPVGHYTEYLPNLRNKLQALPDAAGSNGTYVIEQTGGQMALTPLTTPKEIPDAPTTDGTYNLQVVVSSGTATYSWVSAT